MKKLMIVLFLALFAFTGCKEEEPVYYDSCETNFYAYNRGDMVEPANWDDFYIEVYNEQETECFYAGNFRYNPYPLDLQTGKKYIVYLYCENDNGWAMYGSEYFTLSEFYHSFNITVLMHDDNY